MKLYTEKFTNKTSLQTASLVVVKTANTHKIIAYVGGEYPEVLASGTLEKCRQEWVAAKKWIANIIGE